MELFKIFGDIALRGQTEVTTQLGQVNTAADNTSTRLKSMGDSVTSTGKTMTMWATGPIVAVGTAILGMATAIGNAADRILDLNAITGMSTQAIQEFQYAAGVAGTPVEAATMAMKMFNAQLDAVAKGTGPVNDALIALGVNTEQFINLNTEQQLSLMIEKLQGIEDPAERARMGIELFGRQWEGLAPIVALGAEGLEKARAAGAAFAENEDQLNAANNFRVKMFELKTTLGEVVESLSYALLPAANSMVEVFRDQALPVIITLIGYVQTAAEWFGNLPAPIQSTIITLVAIVAAIGPVLLVVGKLIAIGGTMAATWVKISAAVSAAGGAITTIAGIMGLFNPVVIGVIATLALAYNAFMNWGKIKTYWAEVWNDILVNWDFSLDNLYNIAVDKLTKVVDYFVDKMKYIKDLFLFVMAGMDEDIGVTIARGSIEESKLKKPTAKEPEVYERVAKSGLAMSAVNASNFGSSGGRDNRRNENQPPTYNIDMRGSIFRDDKDMLRRLDRGGAGMQGF